MGLLRTLADKFDPLEKRELDPSWHSLSALGGHHTMSPIAAENLSTVLACVNVISTAVASLPAWIYRKIEHGRSADATHPIAKLIKRGPNDKQTWPDFIEWLVASTLLRGNGLAEIVTDRRGSVDALRPISWDHVTVSLLPNRRLAYDINETFGGRSTRRRLLEGEVLHLKDRSDDGIIGRSRLSRTPKVIQNGIALQEFSKSLYENGLYPSGILSFDHHLSPENAERVRASVENDFLGPTKGAKVMILDGDISWNQVSVTPEDAELLASRRFSTEELARLFQVPPPLVGIWDNSTFTNSETAGRWFGQHTLAPWIRKVEAEFLRSVFSEDDGGLYELEIDLSGFLRGDYQARWGAHKIAVEANILDTDEIREVEGWNPREQKNDK